MSKIVRTLGKDANVYIFLLEFKYSRDKTRRTARLGIPEVSISLTPRRVGHQPRAVVLSTLGCVSR